MIGPFNFKQFNNHILITNDFGRYFFLTKSEFDSFINDNLDKESGLYSKLADSFFVIDSSIERYVEAAKPELRYGKSYVFSATSLHIFVVSNYCNSKCVYCQAQSGNLNTCKMMDEEVAARSVDIALKSPQRELSFEFQGGEPLSNYKIIKYIIEYANSKKNDKIIHYNLVSNLTLLTDEMIAFFKENDVSISTSLDGNREIHNANRPLPDKRSSYDVLREKMSKLCEKGIDCSAIQTTTKNSLLGYKEIIDEYINCGLNSIFIRPLTPLGFALEHWDEIGYTPDDFVIFYKNCVDYLIQINNEGYFIKEGHAAVFLSKILSGYGVNYMELRSPCGASVGQIAYYYDGNIFTCDEGRMLYEMGDDSFKLGNVISDNYDTLMNSKLCKTICKHSIIENLPKCCDCVYQPYCGTCPVVNYARENDVISRTYNNYRCQIYGGMLEVLFDLLHDENNIDMLRSWIN